jgi:hypothetical protein
VIPIDWLPSPSIQEPLTLAQREVLERIKQAIEAMPCLNYQPHRDKDCGRCRAIELIDQELNK